MINAAVLGSIIGFIISIPVVLIIFIYVIKEK